jgi:hypothetical protein
VSRVGALFVFLRDLPFSFHLVMTGVLFFAGVVLAGWISPWFLLVWAPALLHGVWAQMAYMRLVHGR